MTISVRAAFAGLALLACMSAGARDIYVDGVNGNDSAAATTSAPLRTIQAGVDQAKAGDRVIVRSGTYTEVNARSDAGYKGIQVRSKGTSSALVTIMAETTGGAIIDQKKGGVGFEVLGGSYVTFQGFIIRNCYGGGIKMEEGAASNNIVVDSNTIEYCDGLAGDNVGGVNLGGCSYCAVRNNIIREIKVGGVYYMNAAGVHGYGQSNCTIENNTISAAYTGIFHKRSAGIKGLIVRRNIITNVDRGVLYSVGGVGDPAHVDQEVYENYINAREAGVIGTVYETATQSHGLSIHNNVFSGTGIGIEIHGFADTVVQDNIFYNMGQDAIQQEFGNWKTELTTLSNDIFYPGMGIWLQRYGTGVQHLTALTTMLTATLFPSTSKVADPLFVNYANNDWHLASNSPGKGAAHDGRDIGAYPTGTGQIGASGKAPVAPQPPSNVSVQ